MSKQAQENLKNLMIAAQQGDTLAYEKLLTGAGLLAEKFIRKRMKSAETVEDLVQDVLLNIHKAIHTYNAEYPFEPWLYAITRNRLNDHLRKMKKTMEFSVNTENLPESPADSEIGALELQALSQAMDKLSEDQRKIVTLLKLDGKSIKETAKMMNMSEAAVKVAAHRGYKLIFKELEL